MKPLKASLRSLKLLIFDMLSHLSRYVLGIQAAGYRFFANEDVKTYQLIRQRVTSRVTKVGFTIASRPRVVAAFSARPVAVTPSSSS